MSWRDRIVAARAAILPLAAPALLWLGAVYARPFLILPRCAQAVSLCTVASVPAVDRIALRFQNGFPDDLSLYAEFTMGVLMIGVPFSFWLLNRRDRSGRRMDLLDAWRLIGEACLWNGLLTELARILVQRPRPFVYAAPLSQGLNPAHYTSFYSGHTSFTSAAACALLLVLSRRGMLRGKARFALGAGLAAIVLLTAVCRVLSGRHFPTDVLTGIVAGSATTLAVAAIRGRFGPVVAARFLRRGDSRP